MKTRVIAMIKEVTEVIENIPELTHLGNQILRTKCKEVSFENGFKTAEKLTETLKSYRKLTGIGAGLAAPQIGLLHRVFVTYDKKTDLYEAFINPKLLEKSRTNNFYRESCLSSRMLWGDVSRPNSITLSWTNINGKPVKETFSSYKARLVQHEYDHLQGIPCLDKAEVGTIEYCGDVKKEQIR